jgi:hypothetical protein
MTFRLTCFFVLISLIALSAGCAARTEPADRDPNPPETSRVSTPDPSPAPTVEPAPASEPESNPEPTPEQTPTVEPAPVSTPPPEHPTHQAVTESNCCGLFNWLGPDRLMVFDERADGGSGTFIVGTTSLQAEYLSPGYGIPSESGLFAMIEPGRSGLIVRNEMGEEIVGIAADGVAGWLSPDGTRLAWLEPLPIRTPSSSVNRQVRLNVVELVTGSKRSPIDLQAQALEWLPDNRHVVLAGRGSNFDSPGIWMVDTDSGTVMVLHEETFLRAVRLSPDGTQVAFMRLFNEDAAENGLWVLDIGSGAMNPAFESGSYRWDPDSRHIWRLRMEPTGSAPDVLERHSLETGEIVQSVELEGQVLNEQWEISPDGSAVSFWRWDDGRVVVQALN